LAAADSSAAREAGMKEFTAAAGEMEVTVEEALNRW
jgi:hypothetical protein